MTSQSTKVSADSPMTVGTNTEAIRSAMRCTGALLPCACCTMRMIRASSVSAPAPVVRSTNEPRPLIVPATARSPGFLSTGSGSPVIMLSSTNDSPLSTVPSTGILSPGRTDTRSPARNVAIGTSRSMPPANRRAVEGCNPISFLIADEVLPLARSSSNLPSRTKAMIMQEAS